MQNDHIRQGNTRGEGTFLGQPRLPFNGGGAPALQNFWVPLYLCYTLRRVERPHLIE